MGRRRSSQCQLILFVVLALFSIGGFSAADYTNLVFKGCADQNFHDFNGLYKQTLKTLFDDLTSKSSAVKFYKTTSGDGAAINGLFQCRGDLSNEDCYRCMKRAPEMASKLCGEALAARVQLTGCYLRYEISGFRQVSGTELLYKVCGSTRASGDGFGDKLDTALAEIAKGVAASGNGSGFYAGEFQSVYVLGQCEGDLGGGDCVNCVKRAADTAKSECGGGGGAVSAQMYFQRCYISYTYYPGGGVPGNDQKSLSSSSGTGKNSTEKTVAIAMGGLVSVGLVMACLLFTKSAFKKRTPSYKYGG
ncbi:PREDICTED: cysteine-rich repeat secretory protein 11-like isoform X1 [Erythranthe guttata]|uniref:cysteine-rich repeat secretory protein 11-like isoform X1 n=2 Tax=Erythranthe guttata TaxID=4155 RepID=UPI00064DC263|nr:PREDICTED: cysteine-rich repeat secretory protein 11-like isoform X1 [Erythranthe guttata]|eukprot:XP_012828931.1 PREDICTED: cysteine-rich repeat secretory protein 11-like isoform X1 [Erythranthe guttata]